MEDDTSSERLNAWIEQQPTQSAEVDLSIVIPAFNEERRLPSTLIDLIDFCDRRPMSYEVVVVDDGSRDDTSGVVRKFEKVRGQVRLIQLAKNAGKGHAVRVGMLNCRGKRLLFADADGATPIEELLRLEAALDAGADVAIGSRAMPDTDTRVTTSIHRRLLGRMFNFCVNVILLPGIRDTQCGFKLFSKEAASFLFRRQKSDRFSFDVELLYMARRAGLTIAEVAVNWQNVPGSKVNLVIDALEMFRDVFRFKVIHRHVTPELYQKREEILAAS